VNCWRCCYGPSCDRTAICPPNRYYSKDVYKTVREVIELPEPLRSLVSEAILKALDIQGEKVMEAEG